MKIAMMTNSYKPYIAGVPVSIERLSEGLRRAGHEVVVFAPTYKEQKEEEDIVRYRSLLQGIACGFSVPDSLDARIEKEFKNGGFDVIHVHHPMLIGRTAAYLSQKYRVPLVFTYHTRYEQYLHYIKASWLKELLPRYIKNYTDKCGMVLAPTVCIKEYLENTGVTARIGVLPTGIGEEQFETDPAKTEKLRKSLKGDRKYLFLTVSRLAKEKNIDFLLESLAAAKKYGIVLPSVAVGSEWTSAVNCEAIYGQKEVGADFCLAIAGEGPEKERLIKRAGELGLSGDVVFIGKVPNEEIKNYYAAADCFLFASKSETQGIVLLEAMAAGLPVVAVQATGTEDIVKNEVNGYMTEESAEAFNRCIGNALDPCRRRTLRRGALETALGYDSMRIAELAVFYYNMAIYRDRERPGNGKNYRWKYA